MGRMSEGLVFGLSASFSLHQASSMMAADDRRERQKPLRWRTRFACQWWEKAVEPHSQSLPQFLTQALTQAQTLRYGAALLGVLKHGILGIPLALLPSQTLGR